MSAHCAGATFARTLQRRLDPRLDLHAHALAATGHLRQVAVGDASAVGKLPQIHAQLPGPLPDVAGLAVHHASLAVGALRGRDPRRGLQRRLHPGLDLHTHALAAPGHLGHVAVGHPHAAGQVLHGHAQGACALPDEAALAGDDAALAVDGPLSGDLSQDRRDLLPHLRRPRPAPVRNPRQVSRAHAHQGRQLLHGEPPPPCRSPQLALRRRPRRLRSGCHRCRRHHDLLLLCGVAFGLRPLAGKEEGPPPANEDGPCEWGCVVRPGGPAVSGDGPR